MGDGFSRGPLPWMGRGNDNQRKLLKQAVYCGIPVYVDDDMPAGKVEFRDGLGRTIGSFEIAVADVIIGGKE